MSSMQAQPLTKRIVDAYSAHIVNPIETTLTKVASAVSDCAGSFLRSAGSLVGSLWKNRPDLSERLQNAISRPLSPRGHKQCEGASQALQNEKIQKVLKHVENLPPIKYASNATQSTVAKVCQYRQAIKGTLETDLSQTLTEKLQTICSDIKFTNLNGVVKKVVQTHLSQKKLAESFSGNAATRLIKTAVHKIVVWKGRLLTFQAGMTLTSCATLGLTSNYWLPWIAAAFVGTSLWAATINAKPVDQTDLELTDFKTSLIKPVLEDLAKKVTEAANNNSMEQEKIDQLIEQIKAITLDDLTAKSKAE